jgi:hypothetical protein
MQLFFHPRFSDADYRLVWMLKKGYINELCGETLIDLRMGVPAVLIGGVPHGVRKGAPATNSIGIMVTLT